MSYGLLSYQEEDKANEKDPIKKAKYWLEDIKEEIVAENTSWSEEDEHALTMGYM